MSGSQRASRLRQENRQNAFRHFILKTSRLAAAHKKAGARPLRICPARFLFLCSHFLEGTPAAHGFQKLRRSFEAGEIANATKLVRWIFEKVFISHRENLGSERIGTPGVDMLVPF